MTLQNLKAARSLARMNYAADSSEINKAALEKAEKALEDFKAGKTSSLPSEQAGPKKPGAPKKQKTPETEIKPAADPEDSNNAAAIAAADAAAEAASSAANAEEAAEEAIAAAEEAKEAAQEAKKN